MLAKRKKPRFKDRPQTDFPRHRKFVRQHVCIVPGCFDEQIEACHVRLELPPGTPGWARGGKSLKPHDAFTFPACHIHHSEQHGLGERSFAVKRGVNPLKEALDLARNSPVEEVRQFVRTLKDGGR